jgi:hypothetical protein
MSNSQRSDGEISYLEVGDIGLVHGLVEGYCELALLTLRSVDIRFGNCEWQYSTRGTVNDKNLNGRQPIDMENIFYQCSFDVVTMANNYMYDYGPDALMDMLDLILGKSIQTMGAGKNWPKPASPPLLNVKASRLGILGIIRPFPKVGKPDRTRLALRRWGLLSKAKAGARISRHAKSPAPIRIT